MRGWNIAAPTSQEPPSQRQIVKLNVNQAHEDYINVLESNKATGELYSGSKDGVVKVWRMVHEKEKDEADYFESLRLKQVG
mmetsp:Transcript_12779/g.21605  ORF Transcript_12779/g.21605 Transcript_12779/m.21605 type:complete len:81 (+) Transcript_12779:415-657(+)